MRTIKIKRDGSISGAYFFLAVALAVVGLYQFFIVDDHSAGSSYFILGVGLAAIAIFLSDPRPLLKINERGIKPKGKSEISWAEIYQVEFEKLSFENKYFTELRFLDQTGQRLFSMSLERKNVGTKSLAKKIERILEENRQEHIRVVTSL